MPEPGRVQFEDRYAYVVTDSTVSLFQLQLHAARAADVPSTDRCRAYNLDNKYGRKIHTDSE